MENGQNDAHVGAAFAIAYRRSAGGLANGGGTRANRLGRKPGTVGGARPTHSVWNQCSLVMSSVCGQAQPRGMARAGESSFEFGGRSIQLDRDRSLGDGVAWLR